MCENIKKIKVVAWSRDKAENMEASYSGMGGFFDKGMRWKDYVKAVLEQHWSLERAEALRKSIIENNIRRGGDWHQYDDEGTPIFSDGTCCTLTFRAWGDLLAAIWSTEDNIDYGYMDFYLDCTLSKEMPI